MLPHNERMDRQIEVAGAEEPPAPGPVRPAGVERRYGPVIAGALGLLIGSVATIALSQPAVLDATAPDTTRVIAEPDDVAPLRTTTPPIDRPALAELIPGLTTDLIAFGTDSSGFPVVQWWDLDESSPVTTTVRLQSGSADLSMTYIASLEDQRYGDGFDLVVGTPNFVETIAIEAGSFAWSTTTPREIAWTERSETGFVIKSRRIPSDDEAVQPIQIPVPSDVFIAWFRDDTVTVQDNQGRVTTFDRDGAVVASRGSASFASATDIAAVAIIEDVHSILSTDLGVIADIPTASAPCFPSGFAPRFHPSTRRLALLCFADGESSIEVYDIGIERNNAVIVPALPTLAIDQPAVLVWLGSDRFIGFTQPAPAGRPRTDLVIFDLVTGDQHTLSWPGSVSRVIAFSPR